MSTSNALEILEELNIRPNRPNCERVNMARTVCSRTKAIFSFIELEIGEYKGPKVTKAKNSIDCPNQIKAIAHSAHKHAHTHVNWALIQTNQRCICGTYIVWAQINVKRVKDVPMKFQRNGTTLGVLHVNTTVSIERKKQSLCGLMWLCIGQFRISDGRVCTMKKAAYNQYSHRSDT